MNTLANIGLAEFAAPSDAEYVQVAVEMARVEGLCNAGGRELERMADHFAGGLVEQVGADAGRILVLLNRQQLFLYRQKPVIL